MWLNAVIQVDLLGLTGRGSSPQITRRQLACGTDPTTSTDRSLGFQDAKVVLCGKSAFTLSDARQARQKSHNHKSSNTENKLDMVLFNESLESRNSSLRIWLCIG